MFGYGGKILNVDLSDGRESIEPLYKSYAEAFLGGNGFAAKVIHDEVSVTCDPFGEKNIVVFTTGPLNDTPFWGDSRGHMATISPQTNYFADSNYGGNFAVAQKRTGFDLLKFTGKSSSPVYVVISDSGAYIEDASAIWGMNTDVVIKILQDKYGKDSGCACIGSAGENKVLFSSVVFSGKRQGVAGRCGMGAVMGSKRLKAVVVTGSVKTKIADEDGLKKYLRNHIQQFRKNTALLTDLGTPFLVNFLNDKGKLCTHNNSRETFEYANEISGELMKEKYVRKNSSCQGCPIACGKMGPLDLDSDRMVKLPEYESIYALGSMMDNRNFASLIKANTLCDDLGMDTISMGVTLSFVAECLERGIISEKELGGKVNFDDGPLMEELISSTAKREGIGDVLAQGSTKIAKQFGRDSDKLLYAVKGLELPGHSARGVRGLSLGYATATRGGSHHDTRPKYLATDDDEGFDGQVEYNIKSQNATALGDSLIICRFVEEKGFFTQFHKELPEIMKYVTGMDVSMEWGQVTGERVYNLERLINTRRGLSRKEDILPWRVMNEKIPEGASKGYYCPEEQLNTMLDNYYSQRGWSKDGVPTENKLKELKLV